MSIKNIYSPIYTEHVRFFLDLASNYRTFAKIFASIASLLTYPLKKDVPFTGNDAHHHNFRFINHTVTNALALAFPDYILPFGSSYWCCSQTGRGWVTLTRQPSPSRTAVVYASESGYDSTLPCLLISSSDWQS